MLAPGPRAGAGLFSIEAAAVPRPRPPCPVRRRSGRQSWDRSRIWQCNHRRGHSSGRHSRPTDFQRTYALAVPLSRKGPRLAPSTGPRSGVGERIPAPWSLLTAFSGRARSSSTAWDVGSRARACRVQLSQCWDVEEGHRRGTRLVQLTASWRWLSAVSWRAPPQSACGPAASRPRIWNRSVCSTQHRSSSPTSHNTADDIQLQPCCWAGFGSRGDEQRATRQ